MSLTPQACHVFRANTAFSTSVRKDVQIRSFSTVVADNILSSSSSSSEGPLQTFFKVAGPVLKLIYFTQEQVSIQVHCQVGPNPFLAVSLLTVRWTSRIFCRSFACWMSLLHSTHACSINALVCSGRQNWFPDCGKSLVMTLSAMSLINSCMYQASSIPTLALLVSYQIV